MSEEWENFTLDELACKCCGTYPPMTPHYKDFMYRVQYLRTWYGKPMEVASAYRCETHPIEAKKVANGKQLGEHNRGAIDIRVPTEDTHKILTKAFEMGFSGIGINLSGGKNQRFIHLDDRSTYPVVWSY